MLPNLRVYTLFGGLLLPSSWQMKRKAGSEQNGETSTWLLDVTFHKSLVTSSYLGRNIFLGILFSDTLSLWYSLTAGGTSLHTQNNRQYHNSVCFNLYVYRQQTVTQKILKTVTCTSQINFVHGTLNIQYNINVEDTRHSQPCPSQSTGEGQYTSQKENKLTRSEENKNTF